jgi:hypothetical protein
VDNVMQRNALVVISYYDRHPIDNLSQLLKTLMQHPAGGEFDICIVVNRTKEEKISLPDEYAGVPILYRHNLGMNIGAWDHGWRTYPDYRYYLFLQDECYVIRDHWLAGFTSILDDPRIGFVGESLNAAWDRAWTELARRFGDSFMPGHFVKGRPANRIDSYLSFLEQHGVDPGATGRHLRALVWFCSAAVLKEINGFLIGRNYGECIAAEIAASKQVESVGLKIAQVRDEEFFYVRHLEYNQDRPGGPYTHNVDYVSYASVRRLLEARERDIRYLFWSKLQKFRGLKRIRFGNSCRD